MTKKVNEDTLKKVKGGKAPSGDYSQNSRKKGRGSGKKHVRTERD